MSAQEKVLYLNRYRRLDSLTDYGSGIAHKALDELSGNVFALKQLTDYQAQDDDSISKFKSETADLKKLSHPNLLALIELGVEDSGSPIVVSEFVSAESLASIIRKGSQSQEKIVAQMRQIAGALAYLHENGRMHAALSPASILVQDDGELKLTDFAVLVEIEKAAFIDKKAEESIKFVHYMSPEHGRHLPLDQRSEICVAACVFYEMLTGEKTFTDDDPYAVVYKQVNEYPKRFNETRFGSQFSPALESICWKALQKNPANRYQSFAELVADIESFVETGKVKAHPVDEYESMAKAIIERDLQQIEEENLHEQKDSKLMSVISGCILIALALFVCLVGWSILQPGHRTTPASTHQP